MPTTVNSRSYNGIVSPSFSFFCFCQAESTIASSLPTTNGRPATRWRPEIAAYSSNLTPSISLLPVLLSGASTEFCPMATAERTPSTLTMSAVIVSGRRNDSEPLMPIDPEARSEDHTPELQSPCNLVFRLLLDQ